MNNFIPSNIITLLEKIKKIDNASDLLTEIFNDSINFSEEPNLKYFILSIFFQKNVQLPVNDIWMLFKVLVSVNHNLIKENSESNELYALCLKNCVNLLLNTLTNINIEQNSGFKNNEISFLFDFLFSVPLVKHFINFVDSPKLKKEIIDLLNQIGALIVDKTKVTKNNAVKNIINNFSHFLNITEINPTILKNNNNNEDKKPSLANKTKNTKINDKNPDMITHNYINIIKNENFNTININNLAQKAMNSMQNNILVKSNSNSSFFNKNQPSSKNIEKQQNNVLKSKKEKPNDFQFNIKKMKETI